MATIPSTAADLPKGTRVENQDGRMGTVNGVDVGRVNASGHPNHGREYVGVNWDAVEGDQGLNRRSRPFVDELRIVRPAGSVQAKAAYIQASNALAAAEQIQADFPTFADYRIEEALAGLRRAKKLLGDLADNVNPEWDAARAAARTNPNHPFYDGFHAQVKAKGSDVWRTIDSAMDATDAAWQLSAPMQTHGIRHSEMGGEHGHIADLVNGHVLSADDGTEFRVLSARA